MRLMPVHFAHSRWQTGQSSSAVSWFPLKLQSVARDAARLNHKLVLAVPRQRPMVFCCKCLAWMESAPVRLLQPCAQAVPKMGGARRLMKGKHPVYPEAVFALAAQPAASMDLEAFVRHVAQTEGALCAVGEQPAMPWSSWPQRPAVPV